MMSTKDYEGSHDDSKMPRDVTSSWPFFVELDIERHMYIKDIV